MSELSGRPSKRFVVEISERQFYAALVDEGGKEQVICLTSSWSTVEKAFSDMYTLGSGQTKQFTIKDSIGARVIATIENPGPNGHARIVRQMDVSELSNGTKLITDR